MALPSPDPLVSQIVSGVYGIMVFGRRTVVDIGSSSVPSVFLAFFLDSMNCIGYSGVASLSPLRFI